MLTTRIHQSTECVSSHSSTQPYTISDHGSFTEAAPPAHPGDGIRSLICSPPHTFSFAFLSQQWTNFQPLTWHPCPPATPAPSTCLALRENQPRTNSARGTLQERQEPRQKSLPSGGDQLHRCLGLQNPAVPVKGLAPPCSLPHALGSGPFLLFFLLILFWSLAQSLLVFHPKINCKCREGQTLGI